MSPISTRLFFVGARPVVSVSQIIIGRSSFLELVTKVLDIIQLINLDAGGVQEALELKSFDEGVCTVLISCVEVAIRTKYICYTVFSLKYIYTEFQ